MTHDAPRRGSDGSQGDWNVADSEPCLIDPPTRPRPPQGGYECGRCGTRFGTLRAFDDHRDDERRQR